MDGGRGQDHGHGCAFRSDITVGQDQMSCPAADCVFGNALQLIDSPPQRVLAFFGTERAVQFHRAIAHIVSHCGKAGVRQHRTVELQQTCLTLVLGENVAQIAEPGLKAHHPVFAQAVDRRVSDLAERLAEEMM